MNSPRISPTTFAAAFQRLERDIAAYTGSEVPFNFQSGLAYDWEHYKEWVYYEAQRQLDSPSWKASMIGSGQIIERTVQAIEINKDKNHRNNIVAWDGRRGEEAKSHRKLLLARESDALKVPTERALYRMYAEAAAPEECFSELIELFGARYDLISYLFFIRDWQQFLPARPSIFPRAFEELGVPHEMSMRCSWENYSGFLARIREVQRLLTTYDLPGGTRFIDAHSFCWMLASEHLAAAAPKQREPSIVAFIPRAGTMPSESAAQAEAFTQGELDLKLLQQKRIGDLAQSIVLKAERKRMQSEGRSDLACRVEDVSDNVALGYDIASFTSDGSPKPIEVKAAAKRDEELRFFLSEHERAQSRTMANYTFALVLGVESSAPAILEFSGEQLPPEALRSIAYEVRLQGASTPL